MYTYMPKHAARSLTALLGAIFISLAMVVSVSVSAQNACPANGSSFCERTTGCVGLNTGFFGYGSLDKPFIDLMKGAAVSVAGYDPDSIAKNESIRLDAAKYPTVKERQVSVLFYANTVYSYTQRMLPSGKYVVLYDGTPSQVAITGPGVTDPVYSEGRAEFQLNARTAGNTFFRYSNARGSRHVRNIRIVAAAYEKDYQNWDWADYEIGSPANPPLFYPQWLQKMSAACTIRYVNARATNDADAVKFNRDAVDTMVNPAYSTWYDGFGLGADAIVSHVWPWQMILEATRQTNTRPWINFKVMAYENHFSGDRIIERVANLFRKYYGGAIYVEYGNEIWNFAYPFNIASDHVRLNGPGAVNNLAQNYSLRNNLIQRVFADSYGPNNCLALGVLASQGRNPALGELMLSFADTEYVDVLSPTTYVSDNLMPGNAMWNYMQGLYQSVENRAVTQDEAFSRLRDEILTGSEGVVVRNWRSDVGPFTQRYIDMARGANMCTGFYEAGIHMRVDNVDSSNAVHVGVEEFVRDYLRSSQQAEVEKEVTDYVAARSTGPNVMFSSFDNSGGGTFAYWTSVFESNRNASPRAQQLDQGDGGGTGVVSKYAIDEIGAEMDKITNWLKRASSADFYKPVYRKRLRGLVGQIRRSTAAGKRTAVARLQRTMLSRTNRCGSQAQRGGAYVKNCTLARRIQRSLNAIRADIKLL